ncbi:MAG: hypothetical protein LBF09_05100 [Odoribacteraceae bacterium]|jgi:hypothetical protein|nr:hypothetical protein [Odoribacteraceae bacterium]
MIDIQVRTRDRFSVEFKIAYAAREGKNVSEFMLNTWFFVPRSLDINASTYPKEDFYKDVKTNFRLITPVYTTREIAAPSSVPFARLEEAFRALAAGVTRERVNEHEYQVKMFASIVKSALREETKRLARATTGDREQLVTEHVGRAREIARRYRESARVIDAPSMPAAAVSYYRFVDEYLSNLLETHAFRLAEELPGEDAARAALVALAREEIAYRRARGYLVASRDDRENNRAVIYRRGMLKKYVESELFARASTRRDGAWVEQVYYSIAAGLSMIFATIISFSFARAYGNFTMPLFVALVVSYVLKDRIKDLARYYLVHRPGRRYFDHETTLRVKEETVGWIKEGVDFIPEGRVPREVIDRRARSGLLEAWNRVSGEKVILYRKLARVDAEALARHDRHAIPGVNDITRFHVGRFLEKMDGREYHLHVPGDDDTCERVTGEKIYYLNILVQYRHEEQDRYRRFRLMLTREGIQRVEEL